MDDETTKPTAALDGGGRGQGDLRSVHGLGATYFSMAMLPSGLSRFSGIGDFEVIVGFDPLGTTG